jgi:hypothetical protein
MTTAYRIQRGTLSGAYETCYQTESEKAAWRAYFKTRITAGEKKRIQERRGKCGEWQNKKKPERNYWT